MWAVLFSVLRQLYHMAILLQTKQTAKPHTPRRTNGRVRRCERALAMPMVGLSEQKDHVPVARESA